MDGMLSQEEINALLNGIDEGSMEQTEDPQSVSLTDAEKDALGEISNISMGSAATTLSTLVNSKVVITTPVVSYATMEELSKNYDKPCVFIQISYKEGLDGNNVLIMKEADVKVITDLMMGGDGTNIENDLTELHLSAISEAMNQMMGAAATSLSSMLEKKVDISPPSASLIDLNDSFSSVEMFSFLQEEFVVVKFKMEIENLVDSQIMQLYPFNFAREIYQKFISDSGTGSESVTQEVKQEVNEAQPVQQPSAQPEVQQQPMQQQPMQQQPMQQQPMQQQPMQQQPMQQQPMQQQPMQQDMGMPMYQQGMPMNQGMPMYQQPMQMPMGQYAAPMQNVNVQPAQFQTFSSNVTPMMQQENIDLIMDVPLEVTVELGRTNKSIKEILDFSPGTIIELDKLAGEPIDVLVNGKFVAKGEVVVIEENFGIRVTEIIK